MSFAEALHVALRTLVACGAIVVVTLAIVGGVTIVNELRDR